MFLSRNTLHHHVFRYAYMGAWSFIQGWRGVRIELREIPSLHKVTFKTRVLGKNTMSKDQGPHPVIPIRIFGTYMFS